MAPEDARLTAIRQRVEWLTLGYTPEALGMTADNYQDDLAYVLSLYDALLKERT
jgi:hypothetical protein